MHPPDSAATPPAPGRITQGARSFTLRLATAFAAGLAAAVVIAPWIAVVVARLGFHFPFPRIFDRTVMVTLAIALVVAARPLGLPELLRASFGDLTLAAILTRLVKGLLVAAIVLGMLYGGVAIVNPRGHWTVDELLLRAGHYIPAAVVIGLLEEAFFRALVLGGMRPEFGSRRALVISSVIYAAAHLVRAPAHFYLSELRPLAGLTDLGASAAQLGHPLSAGPTLIGLFLLGLVLGEALLLTGNVYFSVGLHAGLVLGAKAWSVVRRGTGPIPRWLAGAGPVPMIAAPAAWAISLVLIAILPRLLGRRTDA